MKKRLLSILLALTLACPTLWSAQMIQAQAAESQTSERSDENASSKVTPSEDYYKAIWFAYYDYEEYLNKYSSNTAANFTQFFDRVLDNCKNAGFNRIIVHVRPFGDAIYKSSYFPTSAYIARKQGGKLTYDPLTIMVNEAHKKDMKIEAWINPYRVATNTKYKKLAKNNPARKWRSSRSSSTRRNVLSYGGRLYYNPAKSAVRRLIINGVKEIVKKYKVDGIHMDDYFYPSFSSRNYKKSFDYKEYRKSKDRKKGMSIENYRRKQVNTLVAGIHSAVKSINPNVTFGISPAGNIDNLTSKYAYYVDIKTWCNSTKYVDYITPQIYWGFQHSSAKFDKVFQRWKAMTNQSKVKMYIGLPAYRMGTNLASNANERQEFKSPNTLQKMITYSMDNGADGITVFDYDDLDRSAAKPMIQAMKNELNK